MKAWLFDQTPNTACITCQSVIDGNPVFMVTHYDDDHSWAFLDGGELDASEAMVVAMAEVVGRHPELQDIADLPPGPSASRGGVGEPWVRQPDA